jgi:plasmid maintenance system killer protein
LEDGSSAVYNGPVTRFLGVYSGRVNEQSDLGFVWKAQALSELVDSIT